MRSKAALFSAFSILAILLMLFLNNTVSPHGNAVFAYPPPPQGTIVGQGLTPKLFIPLIMNNYVSPPLYTKSWYVEFNSTSMMQNLGRTYGTAATNGLVILDFGNPRMFYSGPGTQLLHGGSNLTITDITNLTEYFILGYMDGFRNGGGSNLNPNAYLTVAVGLNNCGSSGQHPIDPHQACAPGGTNMPYSHGQAWAQMVSNIRSWTISAGFSAQTGIVAGMDVELYYNKDDLTTTWYQGYNECFTQHTNICPSPIFIYDFGACEGCNYPPVLTLSVNIPMQEDPNFSYTWQFDHIVNIAYHDTYSYPLPEIYRPEHVPQWYGVSRRMVDIYHSQVWFRGPLTELIAGEYTPDQAWEALYQKLLADPATAITYMPFSTQIDYQR